MALDFVRAIPDEIRDFFGIDGAADKPWSNPAGWPHNPDQEELMLRPTRIVVLGGPQRFRFCSNFIRTSKFTLLTFLPKFLLEEFHWRRKMANVYFFCISLLQTVKEISNTHGIPSLILPLSAVIFFDGIFAALEDIARHKADKKANSSVARVYSHTLKRFEELTWDTLKVGDILKIHNHEMIPSDCFLLGSADNGTRDRIVYVETKSLDGETNLKARAVHPECAGRFKYLEESNGLAFPEGQVEMEHPNKLIDSFSGTIHLKGHAKAPIGVKNVLLRGCTLRNTEYCLCMVINTGNDTKIMMNSGDAPSKSSKLEGEINSQIMRVLLFLIAVCVFGATGAIGWLSVNGFKHWYLWESADSYAENDYELDMYSAGEYTVEWIVYFFYYFLLNYSFIPISLYVSMTTVKFFQSYFIEQDLQMYSEETKRSAQVRTMNLNEELGQISHVFSDKTGTLTCNVMEFRKCSIHGRAYGLGTTAISEAVARVLHRSVSKSFMQQTDPEDAKSESWCGINFHDAKSERGDDPHVCHVDFKAPELFDLFLKDCDLEQRARVTEFFFALAVCHSVVVERLKCGETCYSASSPDDEALVCASKYFGIEFVGRTDSTLTLRAGVPIFAGDKKCAPIKLSPRASDAASSEDKFIDDGAEDVVVEVLENLEFTSKRKRQSVIVRKDDRIYLYSKGADTEMLKRLKEVGRGMGGMEDMVRSETVRHVDAYAAEGLRTLLVGFSELPEDTYRNWKQRMTKAQENVEVMAAYERGEENAIDDLMDEIEQGLTLLGATAIEDKLQDEVPETIEALRLAGVSVWVLTGDKVETAVNIGMAASLLEPAECMNVIEITKGSLHGDTDVTSVKNAIDWHLERIRRIKAPMSRFDSFGEFYAPNASEAGSGRANALTMMEAIKRRRMATKPFGLVIDGACLLSALEPAVVPNFVTLSRTCKSVVACRVSPDQKRQLVSLVNKGYKGCRTLSIGDGANDVPMIQEAHVGVGISGQEGMQAVNASDYAIGQFRFLRNLMLVHGRWNYRRTSKLALYILHKNILMCLGQFFYLFYTGMSGQKSYAEYGVLLFAIVYTCIPVLLVGVYDKDLDYQRSFNTPVLYMGGLRSDGFNTVVLWQWVLSAALEALTICLLPLYMLASSAVTILEFGLTTFSLLILGSNVKMAFNQYTFNLVHGFVYVASVLSWFATSYGFAVVLVPVDTAPYAVFTTLLSNPSYYLAMILCGVILLLREMLLKAYVRWFRPRPYHILQEMAYLERTGRKGGKGGSKVQPKTMTPEPTPLASTAGTSPMKEPEGLRAARATRPMPAAPP